MKLGDAAIRVFEGRPQSERFPLKIRVAASLINRPSRPT